jgi:hypothetical protein
MDESDEGTMKIQARKFVAAATIVMIFTTQARASWFSDLTGVNIDPWQGQFQIGPPQPGQALQRLPDVIQRLPQDVANLANPLGLALAASVREGEAQASYGARPIPPAIFQQLQGFFDPAFLVGVRYNTFDSASINLQTAVMLLNNDVAAITLNSVIVFRSDADAQNPVLWAHELTHVIQYRTMGIDTFANVYTTNAWILENQAIDNQNRFAQLSAQGQGGPFQNQQVEYFLIMGRCYYGDANQVLYPADPGTGQVIGQAEGRIFFQNGQYIAQNLTGQTFLAIRTK